MLDETSCSFAPVAELAIVQNSPRTPFGLPAGWVAAALSLLCPLDEICCTSSRESRTSEFCGSCFQKTMKRELYGSCSDESRERDIEEEA